MPILQPTIQDATLAEIPQIAVDVSLATTTTLSGDILEMPVLQVSIGVNELTVFVPTMSRHRQSAVAHRPPAPVIVW